MVEKALCHGCEDARIALGDSNLSWRIRRGEVMADGSAEKAVLERLPRICVARACAQKLYLNPHYDDQRRDERFDRTEGVALDFAHVNHSILRVLIGHPREVVVAAQPSRRDGLH